MSTPNENDLVLSDRFPGSQINYLILPSVGLLPLMALKDFPVAGFIAAICVSIPCWFLARGLSGFTTFTLCQSALQIRGPFRFNHDVPLAEITELYLTHDRSMFTYPNRSHKSLLGKRVHYHLQTKGLRLHIHTQHGLHLSICSAHCQALHDALAAACPHVSPTAIEFT